MRDCIIHKQPNFAINCNACFIHFSRTFLPLVPTPSKHICFFVCIVTRFANSALFSSLRKYFRRILPLFIHTKKTFTISGNCLAHKLRNLRHASPCFPTKLNYLMSRRGFHLSSQQLDVVKLSYFISTEINFTSSWSVRPLSGEMASLAIQRYLHKTLFTL